MDQVFERLLSALSGEASDEDLKKELADPASEASAAMRSLRIRTRSAFRIKRSVLESDPNLLPLLKFADLCSPEGFKLLPPKEGTRITGVRVRRLKEPRRRLVAVASVTLNNQVVIRGIRIVLHEAHGIQACLPRGPALFCCPVCGATNRLNARCCVACGRSVSRKDKGRLPTSALTLPRKRPPVEIRDKELRALIRQRVLARYHELLVEGEGGARSLDPDGQGISPAEALRLSFHFGSPVAPPEGEAPSSVPPGEGGIPGKGGFSATRGTSADGGPASAAGTVAAGGVAAGGIAAGDVAAGGVAGGVAGGIPAGAGACPQGGAGPQEGEEYDFPAGEPGFPTATDFAVDHPLLKRYWSPAERLAIMLHWFHQCAEQGREISMAEAVGSWEAGPGRVWRAERFWRDMNAQTDEINRHKWVLSMRAHRDVGWDAAESDWLTNHAAAWRKWREQDIESV